MGPTKRARPSFSPPRPGKSKSSKATTSTTKKAKNATTTRKTANGSHKRKASRPNDSEDEELDEEDDNSEEIQPRPKSKNNKSARSFIADEASASEDEDEDLEEEEDEDEEDPEEEEPDLSTFLSRTRPDNSASPEPDMILAEIEVGQPTQSPIPEALVHKMIAHHFSRKDVKMSRDARDLVTKYVEVFVREAIMRSAYERQEKERDSGGGGGFLEVEDLERAAVQLCLDF